MREPCLTCRTDAARRDITAAEPDGQVDIGDLRAIDTLHQQILYVHREGFRRSGSTWGRHH